MLPSDIRSIRDRKHIDDKQNKQALVAGSKVNTKSSKNDSIVRNQNRPVVAEKKVTKKIDSFGKTAEIKHKNGSSQVISRKDDLPHHNTIKGQSSSKLPKLDSYQSLLQYAKEQQANAEKSAESSTKNSNTHPNKAKLLPDSRQSSSLQYNINDNSQYGNVKRFKCISDIAEPASRSAVKGQPTNAMRAAKGNERYEIKREDFPQKYHDKREKAGNHLNNNKEKVKVSDRNERHEIKRQALPQKYRDKHEKARNLNNSREKGITSDRKIKPPSSSTVVPNRNVMRVAPRTGTLK